MWSWASERNIWSEPTILRSRSKQERSEQACVVPSVSFAFRIYLSGLCSVRPSPCLCFLESCFSGFFGLEKNGRKGKVSSGATKGAQRDNASEWRERATKSAAATVRKSSGLVFPPNGYLCLPWSKSLELYSQVYSSKSRRLSSISIRYSRAFLCFSVDFIHQCYFSSSQTVLLQG